MTQIETARSEPSDPFFAVIHDGEWNACVGIQGDAENYVDGYMEAAIELVRAVIEKRMIASRDTLAMPILYNCRHALELSLKLAIERLHRVGLLAHRHPANHDILSHWTHLRDAKLGDAVLKNLVDRLEPFVTSLAAIDDDGQELRYARNRKGEKSLDGIAIVNLPHIGRSILILSQVLKQLKVRVRDLQEERSTGSHTKDCSRSDLEQIAGMLGEHASWQDPSFDEKKAQIREKFGLSSGKFSDTVSAIRASQPLAALVGLESDLTYLSDDKALAILGLWYKANPPRLIDSDDLGMDYFNRDWHAFTEHGRKARELDQAVLDLTSVEELSDLEALFYIGRDRVHGEHYEGMLADTLRGHHLAKNRYAGVHHIMSKMNLYECVIDGAIAVGRPSLAEKIRGLRPNEAEIAKARE